MHRRALIESTQGQTAEAEQNGSPFSSLPPTKRSRAFIEMINAFKAAFGICLLFYIVFGNASRAAFTKWYAY
eukprot:IDg13881t1